MYMLFYVVSYRLNFTYYTSLYIYTYTSHHICLIFLSTLCSVNEPTLSRESQIDSQKKPHG